MYISNRILTTAKILLSILIVYTLCITFTSATRAATLAERAVYDVKILVGNDPAAVGQCSAFAFGDVSQVCGLGAGPFVDNNDLDIPTFNLPCGNGINGDGLAGTIRIQTGKVNNAGVRSFQIVQNPNTGCAFQVDPYLNTPGGTFKTSMENLDFSLAGGTVDGIGNMVLDVTNRIGWAATFATSIGQQPWNIDDSTRVAANGDPTTGLWEPFTTGSASNFNPEAPGGLNITLTGRSIGDANSDGILDAVLVSVGNVGQSWQFFDGTPYSEAFNIQFELISALPVANPDTLNASQDTPLIINIASDLLANDTHATGDPLSFVSFTQPSQAGSTVANNNDGTLTYTPAAGFTGVDSFTYTIEDTANNQDTATVTINVSAAGNTPPVANDVNVTTDEDVPVTFDPTANDTDADGDALTITGFDAVSTQGGAIIDNGNNLLTYTPLTNFNGADSFTYTISDGNGGTDSATVFITVNAVNDPLVCTDVNLGTETDKVLSIDVDNVLLSTCTDPDGDTISLSSTTQPTVAGSMLADNGAGTLTYTPAPGFTGQDTFTYTATDGNAFDTRTVFIDVGKVFGNFTMLDAGGSTFGGTNDVATIWDGSLNTSVTSTNFNMTMGSDANYPFFGFPWSAHDIRVFGPGNYSFDTTCTTAQIQAGVADCGGAPDQYLDLNIGAGQVGAQVLFDWNITKNIDVVLLWDVDGVYSDPNPSGALYQGPAGPTPAIDCVYELVSRDADGDGAPGAKMIDGPFINFQANFNLNLTRNCGQGTVEAPVSNINSPNLGSGGCTVVSGVTSPFRRVDMFIIIGFIAVDWHHYWSS